jgi:hypothetical protein
MISKADCDVCVFSARYSAMIWSTYLHLKRPSFLFVVASSASLPLSYFLSASFYIGIGVFAIYIAETTSFAYTLSLLRVCRRLGQKLPRLGKPITKSASDMVCTLIWKAKLLERISRSMTTSLVRRKGGLVRLRHVCTICGVSC